MSFSIKTFKTELYKALLVFDKKSAAELCRELIRHINSKPDLLSVTDAVWLLAALKNKRLFGLMHIVGDAVMHAGCTSFEIRKLYAQALIDDGVFKGALLVLNELIQDTASCATKEEAKEHYEAYGLRGRLYKQLYIDANESENPVFGQYLRLAIEDYQYVYEKKGMDCMWQAINLAALTVLANSDGVKHSSIYEPHELAQNLLKKLEEKDKAGTMSIWEYAIALEAYVLLGKATEALIWVNKYVTAEPEVEVENPETGDKEKVKLPADAFELGSTLRQFRQIWRLDENTRIGKKVLPILKGALLKQQGGEIQFDTSDMLSQVVTDKEMATKLLEKNFNDIRFLSFDWYLIGKDRCYPVAKIGTEANPGLGTGFLLEGKSLHPKLGEEIVLVTNAHVVSNDPLLNYGCILPEKARIILEAFDKSLQMKVSDIIWTSPHSELDVTILRFEKEAQERIQSYASMIRYFPVSTVKPRKPYEDRLYIIGHPRGESMKISLQDNVFLAAKDQYIHYRTPTDNGSSGSPVFNADWELVGLHHAGDFEKQKLDGSGKTYEANEGIWIKCIIDEMSKIFID